MGYRFDFAAKTTSYCFYNLFASESSTKFEQFVSNTLRFLQQNLPTTASGKLTEKVGIYVGETGRAIIANICVIFSFTYYVSRFGVFRTIAGEEKMNPAGLIKMILWADILSILCMQYPVFRLDGIYVDLKIVPLYVAGYMWGIIPGLIASILPGLYRMYAMSGPHAMEAAILSTLVPAILGGILQKLVRDKFNVRTLFKAAYVLFAYRIAGNLFFSNWKEIVSTAWIFWLTVEPFSVVFLGVIIKGRVKRRRFVNDLKRKATLDTKINIYNYRYFLDKTIAILKDSSVTGAAVSVVLIDVDFFKDYNDTFGHQRGDKILSELGNLLVSSVRNCDIVARYGGEEFIILLRGANAQQAYGKAESIRKSVQNTRFTQEEVSGQRITISLGMAQAEPEDDVESLVKKADIALYRAKKDGRNRTEVYGIEAKVLK